MSNIAYTHRVTLTPLSKFFFGGENYASKNEQAFYFQRSRDFPQQTSLLGLIRYQLLKQNDHFERDNGKEKVKDKAKSHILIGAASFHPENSRIFGIVKRLSPVFLSKDQQHLIPFREPQKYREIFDPNKRSQEAFKPVFQTESKAIGYLMGKDLKSPTTLATLEKYSPKEGMAEGFLTLETREFVPKNKVYVDLEAQIGIYKHQTLKHRRERLDKAEDPVKEQEGFFKHQYKQFQQGFGFGFYLSLEGDYNFESQNCVIFGKEQSMFRLEVEKISNKPAPYFTDACPEEVSGKQLCLVSPARMDTAAVYLYCEGAITSDQSFRCMITEVDPDWNYFANPRTQKKNQPSLSDRYNLIQAGSILQIQAGIDKSDEKDLRNHLTHSIFQSIGYNHFITL